MRIGQLAEATRVSVQTIRFYERRGLLKRPRRTTSGYRDYPEEAVQIVTAVKRLQEIGFTLREAAEFVDLLQSQPHIPAKNRAMAEAKVRSFDEQIARLQAMRDKLCARLTSCTCCNDISKNKMRIELCELQT